MFVYLLSVFLLLGGTTWTVLVTPVTAVPRRTHVAAGVLLAVTAIVLAGGLVYALTNSR